MSYLKNSSDAPAAKLAHGSNRSPLLALTIAILLLSPLNAALAQTPWPSYRLSSYRSSSNLRVQAPPRGEYDPRIDPALIRAARIADSRALRKSTARCWRYVKKALLEAGAVRTYPKTAYAKQAGQELMRNHGFVKLSVRRPSSAPVGAVVVYGGRGAGHVELRTERGFVSDYRSRGACRFPFIGAYARLSDRANLISTTQSARSSTAAPRG